MNSYHQTTDASPDGLRRYRIAAKKQDDIVLGWFLAHPGQALTASEVYRSLRQVQLISIYTPLTSIRRAITNLTPSKLVKTDETRMGPYGRPEHCYRLAKGQQELF